ncbi:UDP-glucose--hexose-1-phosphate uridylyltransferase [Actinomycetaceae bacterium MB13-C1-2]|nr:UDP-glucose--hexose-1-phosphate uridylyltransferase [Actinomycetaceae bacterium MB13-C1-2]
MSPQVSKLVDYAIQRGLIEEEDRIWAQNQVLEVLHIDSFTRPERTDTQKVGDQELPEILDALLDDATHRGLIEANSVVFRDLLDTAIMGRLTPPPREVRVQFAALRDSDPASATNWLYQLSQDTNYIRRDRMARDLRWVAATKYGDLDITINMAKPEKDPRAIAAARDLPAGDYPQCLLCAENEGYAGRANHPARQNHRVAPVTINGAPWFIQYSPYVYYNEHCIVFNREHTPMKIDRAAFGKLLDFVDQFPEYFVGSNADLPIVGGSILAHDHFQGGRFEFAMERAPIAVPVSFSGFPEVRAGIVEWPMSVLRLTSSSPEDLVTLADRILTKWRDYSDEDSFVFAETDGEPHNTITPIARRRGRDFELDLVLRNNITTEEHPMGVFHPHQELHHLKKENIGLIEVMGLAVLPSRLAEELRETSRALVSGEDLRKSELTEKHAEWAESFAEEVRDAALADPKNANGIAQGIVEQKVGEAFATVLEHAGVYKQTDEGKNAFLRFVASVNAEDWLN